MSLEQNLKAIIKAALLEAFEEMRIRGAGKPHPGAVSQPPAPVAPQTPPPAAGSAAPEAVTTYEPVGALIKKLVTTKRPEVLAILKEFGANKGAELKAADWPAVHTKLKALEGTS